MDSNTETIMNAMVALSRGLNDVTAAARKLEEPVANLGGLLFDRMFLLYDTVVSCLPRDPHQAIHGFWVNGNDEIMCRTQAEAETIADFFESIGYDVMHTYHYDDSRPMDECSGFWAAYVDA